jgi:hypothetical protein
MNTFHRSIMQWIRREYGTKVKLGHGGKHPFLTFNDHLGMPHRLRIASTPSSDGHALNNMKRDIKRIFDPVPESPTPLEEMLDDLKYNNMPQPNNNKFNINFDNFLPPEDDDVIEEAQAYAPIPLAPPTEPAVPLLGRVSCYSSNWTIMFLFNDAEAIEAIAKLQLRYGMVQHDAKNWELVPGAGQAHFKLERRVWQISFSAPANAEFFGRTPCEYIIVDDHIMASLTAPPAAIGEAAPVPMTGPVATFPVAMPMTEKVRFLDLDALEAGDPREMKRLVNSLKAMRQKTSWQVEIKDGLPCFTIEDIRPD